MEQVKNILIIGLALIALSLFVFRPSAPYEPPVWVEVPAEIGDSLRESIVSEANQGMVVLTEAQIIARYGQEVVNERDSIIWLYRDSVRIQDPKNTGDPIYLSILTDSTQFILAHEDSLLGVGIRAVIGLHDTTFVSPYQFFVHDFHVDSLAYKVRSEPKVKPNWVEWILEWPDRLSIVALVFMILGKI